MTGEDLVEYRAQRWLTQTELAEFLGVSRNTVSRWENGNMKLDKAVAFLLMRTVWNDGVGIFDERETNP